MHKPKYSDPWTLPADGSAEFRRLLVSYQLAPKFERDRAAVDTFLARGSLIVQEVCKQPPSRPPRPDSLRSLQPCVFRRVRECGARRECISGRHRSLLCRVRGGTGGAGGAAQDVQLGISEYNTSNTLITCLH